MVTVSFSSFNCLVDVGLDSFVVLWERIGIGDSMSLVAAISLKKYRYLVPELENVIVQITYNLLIRLVV